MCRFLDSAPAGNAAPVGSVLSAPLGAPAPAAPQSWADRNSGWMGGAVGALTQFGGGMMQANSASAEGSAMAQKALYDASQLTQQAGQTRAASQQQAIELKRNTDLTLSHARAVAAASGAGATDPTVQSVRAQIRSRGEYDALSALYNGEERARGMENQASLDRWMAPQYQSAGDTKSNAASIKSLSTLFGQGQTLWAKYGSTTGGAA